MYITPPNQEVDQVFSRPLFLSVLLISAFCTNTLASEPCDEIMDNSRSFTAGFRAKQSALPQIASENMINFWRTLSAEEQMSVVLRFHYFWENNYTSQTNWDDSYKRFAEFTQWTLNSNFENLPYTYKAEWLKQFFKELQSQSSTSEEAKQKLESLIHSVRASR